MSLIEALPMLERLGNGEDGKGLGRFWQGRYKAVRILDEVSIDERKDPLGPHASRNGKRSSDKGFLAMAEAEYLENLDWLYATR